MFFSSYVQTYLQRDVRDLLRVGDLSAFDRFVRACAARTGQLLNLANLARDVDVSIPTAKSWLSVLEASFVVHLLRPFHTNATSRLVKAPKLYFLDTGLLCSLLGIRSPSDLAVHASRGAVFESFVLSELIKAFVHRGRRPPLYFWRDSAGHEIDFLVEEGETLVALEAKSGATITTSFFDGVQHWRRLVGEDSPPGVLVHGGAESYVHKGAIARSWQTL